MAAGGIEIQIQIQIHFINRISTYVHTLAFITSVNKAIRDGKYLARHMPVLGNVNPITIENFDIFS